MRATAWFEAERQNVRTAARQLRRDPGFTAIAVLTLALGIGANSAIFSVVDSVLLRPLPYAHADRLFELRERNGPRDAGGMNVTYGNFGEWRDRVRDFDALGAYSYAGFTLVGVGEPQHVAAFAASAGYWHAMYRPPVVGRYYGPEDDVPGAPHVTVLSYAFWQSTFGGDPRVVGRTIRLDNTPYTVVGVAPADYSLTPNAPAIWVPLALTPAQLAEHGDHELTVIGRVRDGIAPAAAIAELTRIETDLAQRFPNAYFDGGIVARPLRDSVVGPVRPLLLILLGAVGLVLLIACGNVMNLLLARAAVRRKEVAIRCALGANRARLLAQLLTESVLLALLGAAAGLAVAALGVRALLASAPLGVPRLQQAGIDGSVLAFTMLLAMMCGIGFGLVPALRSTRVDLQQTLRDGARGSKGSLRAGLRAALVIGEISLSLVLLVGAGLLVRSAIALEHVDPGFNPHDLLVLRTGLSTARYPSDTAVGQAFVQVAAAVAAVPGVRQAALVSRIPIGAGGADCSAYAEGAAPADKTGVDANLRTATSNYFSTIGDPIVRGRAFTAADVAGSTPVVIINRGLAHRLFGDADPIGRRLAHCSGPDVPPVWREVVGVTGDVRASGLAEQPPNEVYYPMAQFPQRNMSIVVRSAAAPAALTPAIRHAVAAVDPQLALSGVSTMDAIISDSMATPRFAMLLLVTLGATGLTLAAVGIYGLIAYFVSQRAHEIGIRMALGAGRARVLGMVLRQGVVLVAAGVAAGLVVAFAAARALSNLLYGVGAHDPITFAAVGGMLFLVAVAATAIPARRATKLNPLEAMGK